MRFLRFARMHERYGHIQEVIIQNFRAKPTIPMRFHPDADRTRYVEDHRFGAFDLRWSHEYPSAAQSNTGWLWALPRRRYQ